MYKLVIYNMHSNRIPQLIFTAKTANLLDNIQIKLYHSFGNPTVIQNHSKTMLSGLSSSLTENGN